MTSLTSVSSLVGLIEFRMCAEPIFENMLIWLLTKVTLHTHPIESS